MVRSGSALPPCGHPCRSGLQRLCSSIPLLKLSLLMEETRTHRSGRGTTGGPSHRQLVCKKVWHDISQTALSVYGFFILAQLLLNNNKTQIEHTINPNTSKSHKMFNCLILFHLNKTPQNLTDLLAREVR